jgi:DNA ligase-1
MRGRLAKVERLAECLRGLPVHEGAIAALYLTGKTPQGRLGVGPAPVRTASEQPPADRPRLAIAETDRRLDEIAAIAGNRAQERRRAALGSLLAAATQLEQRFIVRLLLGELRQGALAGLILEAVAAAAVRRAHMLSGDLMTVVRAAFTVGSAGMTHTCALLVPKFHLGTLFRRSASTAPHPQLVSVARKQSFRERGAQVGETVKVFPCKVGLP